MEPLHQQSYPTKKHKVKSENAESVLRFTWLWVCLSLFSKEKYLSQKKKKRKTKYFVVSQILSLLILHEIKLCFWPKHSHHFYALCTWRPRAYQRHVVRLQSPWNCTFSRAGTQSRSMSLKKTSSHSLNTHTSSGKPNKTENNWNGKGR